MTKHFGIHCLARAIPRPLCKAGKVKTVRSIMQMKKLRLEGWNSNLLDFTSELLLSHNHGSIQVAVDTQ